jgi:hypothetical protein
MLPGPFAPDLTSAYHPAHPALAPAPAAAQQNIASIVSYGRGSVP